MSASSGTNPSKKPASVKLSAEEMETAIVQSASDRKDGKWLVFSDDPYWIRRLDRVATKVRADGSGAWYEIQHRQITLRSPIKAARLASVPLSEGKRGHQE